MATLGTFTAGQVLTAAELNAISTWTAFTPSWTTGVTVGNGINDARYIQLNELVIVYVDFELGSTSAITGDVRMVLPVNAFIYWEPATNLRGFAGDVSTATYYPLMGTAYSGSYVRIRAMSASSSYVVHANLASNVPIGTGWATGDHLIFSTSYKAA